MIIRLFKLIILFLFSSYLYTTKAQTLPNNIIPPSPSSQAFHKYGDYPVSHFTGVPNISIPLYTVKVGDLELPITLDYHASGIKLADENGFVGLGWTLNAGGRISKTIIGHEDENGKFEVRPTKGLTEDTTALTEDISKKKDVDYFKNTAMDCYPYSKEMPNSEYDIYSYGFNGKSGKFVFRNNYSRPLINKIITIPNPLGADFQFTILVTDNENLYPDTAVFLFPYKPLSFCGYRNPKIIDKIAYFKILDENGTQYLFGNELNSEESSSYSTQSNTSGQITSGLSSSGWLLTEMKSQNNNNVINLNYTKGAREAYCRKSQSRVINDSKTISLCDKATALGLDNNAVKSSTTTFYYETSVINEIKYRTGKVVFVKSSAKEINGTNGTLDQNMLKEINVYNGYDDQIKHISFIYDVFGSGDADKIGSVLRYDIYRQENIYRYKLKEIRISKTGTDSDYQSYLFNYIGETGDMPISTTSGVDFWGYLTTGGLTENEKEYGMIPKFADFSYDINLSKSSSCFGSSIPSSNATYSGQIKRYANLESMQLYTLNRISYPTGGCSTFEYDAYQYADPVSINKYYAGGLRISRISNYNVSGNLSGISPVLTKTYSYGGAHMDVVPNPVLYCSSQFGWFYTAIDISGPDFRQLTISSAPCVDLAPQGAPVVYEDVTESISDGTSISYKYSYKPSVFSQNTDKYDFEDNTVSGKSYPKIFQTEIKDNESGLLVSKRVNGKSGNYTETYEYKAYNRDLLTGLNSYRANFGMQNPLGPTFYLTVHGPFEEINSCKINVKKSFKPVYYDIISSVNLLTKVTKDEEDYGIKKSTEYDYGNIKYQQIVQETTKDKNNAEVFKTIYKYPSDLNPLMSNTYHIYTPVIMKTDYLSGNKTTEKSNDYKLTSANYWALKNSTTYNKSKTILTEYFDYDGYGNVVKYSNDNLPVNYQMCYQHELGDKPIVVTKNCDISNILFDSFETPVSTTNGHYSFDFLRKFAGKYSLKIETPDLMISGNQSIIIPSGNDIPYEFSIWVYSDGPVAKIGFDTKDVDSRIVSLGVFEGTKTYQWYKLTGEVRLSSYGYGSGPANPINYSIGKFGNGNLWFDHLILKPKGEVMNSTLYTYDEMGNLTSQTDTNGEIKNYSYDIFGRLISISKGDGSLLKTFEYNMVAPSFDSK